MVKITSGTLVTIATHLDSDPRKKNEKHNLHIQDLPRTMNAAAQTTHPLKLLSAKDIDGMRNGKLTKLAQIANSEMVWFDHDANTTLATFSTGPHVFQIVHWNMLRREKMSKIYHLME